MILRKETTVWSLSVQAVQWLKGSLLWRTRVTAASFHYSYLLHKNYPTFWQQPIQTPLLCWAPPQICMCLNSVTSSSLHLLTEKHLQLLIVCSTSLHYTCPGGLRWHQLPAPAVCCQSSYGSSPASKTSDIFKTQAFLILPTPLPRHLSLSRLSWVWTLWVTIFLI
jgi:hypothetical protein